MIIQFSLDDEPSHEFNLIRFFLDSERSEEAIDFTFWYAFLIDFFCVCVYFSGKTTGLLVYDICRSLKYPLVGTFNRSFL